MAEAIISEIAKIVGEKLISRALKEILFAKDINSHIESLENTKITIEALLLDADAVQSPSHVQRKFLERVSCSVDKLDDFLDAKAVRAKMQEVAAGRSTIERKVYSFFSFSSNAVVSAFRDARKVRTIRKELDSIVRDLQFGKISVLFVTANQKSQATQLETGSYIVNEEVIGRDRDRDKIISMLIDSSCNGTQHTLSVVPIVGIGGIGKSTLAQYVYNDERVKINFDVRLWVYATQDFNIKQTLEKILECATNEKLLHCEMDQLQCRFLQQISGKRYLLVLDSIWDHHGLGSNWGELRKLLLSGAPGSKVLITTRSESVARRLGTKTDPYVLMDLAAEDSWLLFQKVAFRPWQELGVVEIGKEIAKMCRNVPLVICTIGGLLAEKCTVKEWRAFRDDESMFGGSIEQTLKLSYDELDPSLKLCFAYCSLFPKGFKFNMRELINVFIGVGYIVKKCKKQSLVDAGEECVLSLLKRGFFHNAEKDWLGSIVRFAMHDLIHDLAVSISGCKYQRVDSETCEIDDKVRHVSFSKEAQIRLDSLSKARNLRSLLYVDIRSSHPKLTGLSKFFPYLRVLSLQGLKMEEVPRSIGELIHLRHLDLSNSDFSKLPNAVTQLVSLLSLNLSCCTSLEELPKGLRKLVNLGNLQLIGCQKLRQMPCGFGKLTNLQTLDWFVAGHPSPSDVEGGLSELSTLNNLEGQLEIRLRGHKGESRAANLRMKKKLTALSIDFSDLMMEDHEKVLEGLQPHAKLRGLEIWGYEGESLPSWMMKNQLHCSLPNLVKIDINSSKQCKHICSFGRLPHLKVLLLQDLESVEYVEEEEEESGPTTTRSSGGEREREGILENTRPSFPSLEELQLFDMPQLKGWRRMSSMRLRNPTFPSLKKLDLQVLGIEELPDEFRGLSSLQSLFISGCDELKEIPEWIEEFTSLKTLSIWFCPKLMPLPKQIGNLPNLKIIDVRVCAGAFEEWWQDPTLPDCPFNHLAPHTEWIRYRNGFCNGTRG